MDGESCLAVAKAGAARLQIVVRPDAPIRLSLFLPADTPDRPMVRFDGPAGRWLASATHGAGHETVVWLSATETSLGRVLITLSGGLVTLDVPGAELPGLSLPESGPEGQRWFACARRTVTRE